MWSEKYDPHWRQLQIITAYSRVHVLSNKQSGRQSDVIDIITQYSTRRDKHEIFIHSIRV